MAGHYPHVVELGRLLSEARVQKGLSYSQLGKRSQVDPGQCHRICNGNFKRLDQNVMQICSTLGIKPPGRRLPLISVDPPAQMIARELMEAWDQTPEGADRLVQVLRAMREYRG